MKKRTYHHSHVDIRREQRRVLVALLNAQLASAMDLYLRVRQSHWNVRGPQFFARHELFDRLGAHLNEMADTLAERIGALGGAARGDVRSLRTNSELPDGNEAMIDVRSHIRALVLCYSAFAAQLRRALIACAGEADPVSEDILVETLRIVEKDMWFLDSHLPSPEPTPAMPPTPLYDITAALEAPLGEDAETVLSEV